MFSAVLVVAAAAGIASAAGCSAFGQGKKTDPAAEAAEAARVPCDRPCCCKRVEGYYVRYTCTDAGSCAAKHGECLPGETRECAS